MLATRLGNAFNTDKLKKFVVDFEAEAADEKGGVSPVVEASGGAVMQNPVVQYNPLTRTWRLFFDVEVPARTEGERPVIELRAYLRRVSGRCSEIWSYQWKP